jgi:hypothetical protein
VCAPFRGVLAQVNAAAERRRRALAARARQQEQEMADE